uniref:BHLH domain-containing protein n=1 Tax=Ananas comosus var. bracteatus TaxID=296719 RepID=A0A6V7Q350_ANACO|nr:unnamed protein product [Ananas comosus var. bracteatus]
MQSDQIVGASSVNTPCSSARFGDQYFGQAMDFNGPSGFSKYNNSATQQRLQFYNPSADFSTGSKRSNDKNFKGKKRKGVVDGVSMYSETPQDRIQQMEVKMESLSNAVEKDEIKLHSGNQAKESTFDGDASKDDYIHVRAKRGQATNSHSLAERVRREKISERMRLLQDLVPGCSKITGKAMMLDEIINYVQSLQRQVEFLSMKLAAVNPEMSFNLEQILTKDILQSRDMRPALLGSGLGLSNVQSSFHGLSPNGIVHPEMLFSIQNPGNTPATSIPQFPTISQIPGLWDDELQNIIHMGFIPNAVTGGTENSSTNLNFGFESHSRKLFTS